MRYPNLDRQLLKALSKPPSIGQLADLAEENYQRVLRLAPDVAKFSGSHRSRIEVGLDLHLDVLEQGPFTSLIVLTHYFHQEGRKQADPAAKLRLYHDANQLDLIDLKQKTLPAKPLYESPGLVNKWRLQWFLSKWLDYCLSSGYYFEHSAANPHSAPNALVTG